VSLISALLSASTSAFITQVVETSLWVQLSPGAKAKRLTVGESRHLAKWTVSSWGRITYIFKGAFWSLRFAGLFVLAFSIISPILLHGITPQTFSSTVIETTTPSDRPFAGFLDNANGFYNGGDFRDDLHEIAAVASMSGLNVPSASLCQSGYDSCNISARASAIFADCQPTVQPNPNGLGLVNISTSLSGSFCSSLNPDICLTLTSSSRSTFANFTTGDTLTCATDAANNSQCDGQFAIIFGVWSGNTTINTIDCNLFLGNITISQNGSLPPTLSRSSFDRSSFQWPVYQPAYDPNSPYTQPSIQSLWRIYATDESSPYTFSGAEGGTGSDSLYQYSVGLALLNITTSFNDPSSTASSVAQRLERNFDAATLSAFVRAPAAAEVTVKNINPVQLWVYDKVVLAILLVPALATLLPLFGRIRVERKDVCLGYDPVAIAARGLIRGSTRLSDETELTVEDRKGNEPQVQDRTVENDSIEDIWEVWGVQNESRVRLMVGRH
jgi:hypothetical protein